MSKKITPSTLFFSLSVISIGFLLLLNNLQLVTSTDWVLLANMWPLLLVLLGYRFVASTDRLYNYILIFMFGVVWFFLLVQITGNQNFWNYWSDAKQWGILFN